MNKDMINIDDFVREKLDGQPERQDPAAWLKMKALLDKEMPERVVPFYFRLGKPMAFLGAALLLSALCVGGYEITKAIRGKNDVGVVTSSLNKSELNGHSSNSRSNTTVPSNNNTLNNNKETPQLADSKENDNRSNTIAQQNNPKKSSSNNNIASNNSNIEKEESASTSLPSSQNVTNSKNTSLNVKHQATSSIGIDQNGIVETKNGNTLLRKKNINAIDKPLATTKPSNVKEVVDESANIVNLASNKNVATHNKKSAATKSTELAANQTGLRNTNDAANNVVDGPNTGIRSPKTKKSEQGNKVNNWAGGVKNSNPVIGQKSNQSDSIPFTNIVQKETLTKGFPRKAITSIDTQDRGKIALPAIAEASLISENKEPIAEAKNDVKKSTEKASNPNQYAAVSNANGKPSNMADSFANNAEQTKTKKAKRASLFENLNLSALPSDMKRDLGNAQFYAGFSGGLNYSLSNTNNFQGVQFGPTGELVFNKHWSLFGAIRYFNRSGGTKTVNDHYAKESANNTPDSTSGANWYFMVHTDSTNRYFNFSTLHSFEMPITLRYALNKFYFLTGLNLAYYLSVNVEEVQKTYTPVNSHMVQTNSAKPMLKETKPLLNTTDFGSKFGLGFVVGAGYQIAPAWQADVKLVNTFWDNSKGDGANKLSKDFYKLPSVQISVGYQFNRARVKPTYGPTSIAP